MQENTDQKKLRIWTLFTLWVTYHFEHTASVHHAQLGTQDNVFKTATKWLCTIYSIIKTLRLSGKNAEKGFHNLIHKQAIWEAFCRWSVTFLRAKLKYSQLPTLRKWPNREKEANFQSQFSYQNAVLLIKFHAGGKIFFPSRSYDIQSKENTKNPGNKSPWLLQKLVTLLNLGYLFLSVITN